MFKLWRMPIRCAFCASLGLGLLAAGALAPIAAVNLGQAKPERTAKKTRKPRSRRQAA